MSADLPMMTSYFSEETMLSVRVPDGWSGQVLDGAHFRIYGPTHPELDDYRPTMSFQRTGLVGEGDAWFVDFASRADAQLAVENPGFEHRGEEWFTLSSLARVHVTHFTWQDEETGYRFAQMQALIMGQDGHLLVANAAALVPIAEPFQPIFDAVLRSTRLIPPDPSDGAADGPGTMIQVAMAFFEEDDWTAHVVGNGDMITATHKGQNGTWICRAVADEEDQVFRFYSICAHQAPEERIDEVAKLLMMANHAITLGNFDLDYDEGTIRFRTSIDVEGDRLSVALVRQLVEANVTMMDLYLPQIRAATEGEERPDEDG